MRTIVLPQSFSLRSSFEMASGPGAPIFQHGTQTRIFRAPVRALGVARLADGSEAWGQVLDISLGGCLFKTDDPMNVGDEVELRITILAGQKRRVADVRGRIRRVDSDGDRPAYGVELVAANSDERRVHQWLYTQALRR